MNKQEKIILVADDDRDDQELLQEAFLKLDHEAQVHAVFSGDELIQYLLKCPEESLPCLIVLDYNMPRISGPDVLDYLCKNNRYKDIPAVVWSTSDSPYYKVLCQQNGAKHYFRKPDDFLKVSEMAREMLRFCGGEN